MQLDIKPICIIFEVNLLKNTSVIDEKKPSNTIKIDYFLNFWRLPRPKIKIEENRLRNK